MTTEIQQDTIAARGRYLNVSLVTLCLGFQNIAIYGTALFLPEIKRELGLTFAQGGAFLAASLLTYALMQIPAGFFADRLGYKKVFVTGALGATALCLTFGFFVQYWQGVTIHAFSGVFRALLFAPGLALLASWFSAERRASAMSLTSSGVFLGQVIISVVGPLIAATFNWRLPFIIFAALGLVIAAIYLWLGREVRTEAKQRVNLLEVFRLFRYWYMWLFGIIQFVRFAVFQGVALWLPSLLIDERGLSFQVTGLIVGLRALIIVPSSILGAYISDRVRKPILIIIISLVISCITTIFMVRVESISLLVVLIVINAIFVQFYFGPLFAMPVDILGKRMAGTATGFSNFFANLGAVTVAYLLGVLKDASGSFESGFYVIAGICIIGVIFTFLLARVYRKPALKTA